MIAARATIRKPVAKRKLCVDLVILLNALKVTAFAERFEVLMMKSVTTFVSKTARRFDYKKGE
jgi:hypothetical protein